MSLFHVTQYVCLPIVIGILTLAFPILLQSISRIDEKYNTSVLIKVFRNECLYKWFNRILYFSLVAVFIHFTLQAILSWLFDLSTKNTKLIENISSSILIFFTIVLIVIVIRLIKLIMTYYDHSELLQRISQRFKSFDDENTAAIDAYRAIANFILSKNDDRANGVKIIYETLGGYTKEKYKKGENFSNSFYTTFSTLNKTLCQQKSEPNAVIKGYELLNVLLPPRPLNKEVVISNDTYTQLADALSLQLNYGKIEWVYICWSKLSRLRKFHKDERRNDYINLTGDTPRKTNRENDVKVIQSNQNLMDFQIQLAAMVLHKEEYKLLGKIFSYTQSQRSRQPHVPSTFSEIFTYCVRMNKIPVEIPFCYNIYFPIDAKSIKIHENNRAVAYKYLALLLFRLNAKGISHLSSGRVWKLPEAPNDLNKLDIYLDYIKELKKEVEFWNENKEHEAFKTFEIMPQKEKRDNPLKRLELLESLIKMNMNLLRKGIELKTTNEYLNQTKNIFKDNLSHLKTFTSNTKAQNSEMVQISGGDKMMCENEAFSNNSRYINSFATKFFTKGYVGNMNGQFTNSFLSNGKVKENASYSFYAQNIFKAINKIIDKNKDAFIIINASYYFDFFINENISKIDGLLKIDDTKYKYQGIEIRYFDVYPSDAMNDSLIVVPKEKLPYIEAQQPTEEELQAYFLNESNKIDNELSLYAGITKAKDSEAIREELLKKDKVNEENVDIYCLASIYSRYNIYWAKDTELAVIKVLYKSNKRVKPSNLKDVKLLNLPKEEEK